MDGKIEILLHIETNLDLILHIIKLFCSNGSVRFVRSRQCSQVYVLTDT
jgi:hypothetical protein